MEAAERVHLQAEEDFYEAVSLEELFEKLMQPLSPEGQLWTDKRVNNLLAEFAEQGKALPQKCARRVLSHARRHRSRWCAHRVLWELIEVRLRPGTVATTHRVLEMTVARWWAKKREREGTRWSEVRAAQPEREACERWLGEECSNVPDVEEAVESLLERPRRSSLVEALNSRFRVLQQGHRKVSDGLLALVAVAWNRPCPRGGPWASPPGPLPISRGEGEPAAELLGFPLRFHPLLPSPRETERGRGGGLRTAPWARPWNLKERGEGARRGPSPWAQWGIEWAEEGRAWWEVVLEEMDREEAAN